MNIFKNISTVAFSMVWTRMFLFSREYYLAAIYTQHDFGTWTLLLIFLNYSLLLPFGFQNLMSRNIPRIICQSDHHAYSLTVISTQVISLVSTFTILVAINTYLVSSNYLEYLHLFSVFAVCIIVQQYNANLSIILRSKEMFKIFAAGSIYMTLINGALLYLFGANLTLIKVLISYTCSLLIISIYWYRCLFNGQTTNKIHIREIIEYLTDKIKPAFSLFITSIAFVIIPTLDRLLSAYYFSMEELATYGFAGLFMQAIALIIQPVNQTLQPKLLKKIHEKNKDEILKPFFNIYFKIMPIITLLFLYIIQSVLNYTIPIYQPKYIGTISILSILIYGSAFYVVATNAHVLLMSFQYEEISSKLNIICVCLYTAIIVMTIHLSPSISSIAVANVIFMIMYALISYVCAYMSIRKISVKKSLQYFINDNKYLIISSIILKLNHGMLAVEFDVLKSIIVIFISLFIYKKYKPIF